MALAFTSPVSDNSLPTITHALTLKLDENNYPLWLAQIRPLIRSRRLLSIIDGTEICPPQFLPPQTNSPPTDGSPTSQSTAALEPNPAYDLWIQKDQTVLSWLTSSLTPPILSIVSRLDSAREVWIALERRFASTNQNRLLQLRSQLFRTMRGDLTISAYLDKIKRLADNLALSGSPVSDSDLLTIIMTNVGPLYENTVAAVQARETPITYPDLEALLLSAEQRLQPAAVAAPDTALTALAATRGRGNFSRGRRPSSRGNISSHHGSFSGNSSRGSSNHRGGFSNSHGPSAGLLGPHPGSTFSHGQPNKSSVRCQICHKPGHSALTCRHRLNVAYESSPPPERLTAYSAQTASGGPTPWVFDTGANTHVTNDLSNLSLANEYRGSDSVGGVLGGTGLPIHNIGSSYIIFRNLPYSLNDVLHCPKASTHLISVNKFARDHNCCFVFFPYHFLVQDLATGKILFRGQSRNGLYPFTPTSNKPPLDHVALHGVRVGGTIWHSRLGHPSSLIFKHLFSNNQLPTQAFILA
ncbi:hypothetical protein QQ045_006121 [Rhodiola kirilowii]